MWLPVLDVPRGPVTVPEVVLVPFGLLVVVPFTVDVPSFGPVTVPEPFAPVRVLVALPCAAILRPFAPVAVPVPETVLPLRDAEPVAVLPCRPVTVCCPLREGTTQNMDKARMI